MLVPALFEISVLKRMELFILKMMGLSPHKTNTEELISRIRSLIVSYIVSGVWRLPPARCVFFFVHCSVGQASSASSSRNVMRSSSGDDGCRGVGVISAAPFPCHNKCFKILLSSKELM